MFGRPSVHDCAIARRIQNFCVNFSPPVFSEGYAMQKSLAKKRAPHHDSNIARASVRTDGQGVDTLRKPWREGRRKAGFIGLGSDRFARAFPSAFLRNRNYRFCFLKITICATIVLRPSAVPERERAAGLEAALEGQGFWKRGFRLEARGRAARRRALVPARVFPRPGCAPSDGGRSREGENFPGCKPLKTIKTGLESPAAAPARPRALAFARTRRRPSSGATRHLLPREREKGFPPQGLPPQRWG